MADIQVIPNEDVHHVLTVCGITAEASRQVFIIVEEGLDSLEAFGDLSGDHGDVTEMAKRRIQGLVYWVKDHQKRNLEANYNDWNVETMRASMARKESEKNFEKVDIDMIDPGKCVTDHGWDAWQIGFVNKLSATIGAAR